MSELLPRQCHKCQGVMIPVRKTTYNFIASTYHYECTSCHAKTSIPDGVTRFLQVGVGGAMLYFSAAADGLLLPGIGAIIFGYGLLAGRRNPILDPQALAGKVAAREAGAFHPGAFPPQDAAAPAVANLIAQVEAPFEKPRVMAPAAPARRPTVERVGGFGRRNGTIRGVVGR